MSKYRTQRHNANKHTVKGKQLLSESIQRDGYIGAVTVAADGETFAGSARLELGKDAFEQAIEVHTNGEPVVIVRDDIPNADDPKAKRLGVADNVVHGLDWEPDAAILAEIANDDELVKRLAQEDAKLRMVLEQETRPPTLDELSDKYGEPDGEDFYPVIRVRVRPECKEKWDALMAKIPTDEEMTKVEILLGAVDESLLGNVLS